MKKYIVLSVNDNLEYLYYLPLTCWAWRKFGWEVIGFVSEPHDKAWGLITDTCAANGIEGTIHGVYAMEGYKSETIAQVARLYAACVKEGYLMTGDIDMIPLSDYWKFDENEITTWGHDLTAYQHYPICYIGMPSTRWVEVMGLRNKDFHTLINEDLDSMVNAKSEDSVKRWVVDQDLITQRLNDTQFNKIAVKRGSYKNGYPIGRVDRSAWTLKHDVFIDAHLPRSAYNDAHNFKLIMNLLHKIWPEESFKWFALYTENFRKLAHG